MLIIGDNEFQPILPTIVRDVDAPTFAFPFTFNAKGEALVVQQGTVEDVASCAANIAVCPIGFRTDAPDFGAPDPSFATLPLDTGALADAITRWEPRASVDITADAAADDRQWEQAVTVDVEVKT